MSVIRRRRRSRNNILRRLRGGPLAWIAFGVMAFGGGNKYRNNIIRLNRINVIIRRPRMISIPYTKVQENDGALTLQPHAGDSTKITSYAKRARRDNNIIIIINIIIGNPTTYKKYNTYHYNVIVIFFFLSSYDACTHAVHTAIV